ncbi:bifunctional folylpolyglutamate synthase/dihydrofolate synthase [Bacillus sp. ISL-40]|uniref:bifunctional folylpolyglutamate synthase/dihydrofolate synthase n=1 Tax=unclassified Bacillus (in: firmicutes) TaxID=185979 RepID=UPI001BEB2FE3|nr:MULTISPECIES: folylpolyglutamate synthase/dihydrofolate synthase family protein [unclassified Bacillus (in: firmicutes)]MBT2697894.1 bifunctional folylpolyglutamate synthase/dihydrofolate synthase [Bacillus sp. ISL-40]MBT2721517.1 bifunctional folylpolyglutamate synthase/dihydrofolate synthase [Bacillus sp. ISL-46]
MFATYKEALEWIHARLRLGIKPGLKRIEWMMDRLGNPETKMKTVHIGGTNGKGSTVTFLRSILEAGGYSVGTFTSPYIEQFNERISVNGKAISDAELLQLANIIRPLADELEETELGGPTEFEVITAMAFHYFATMNKVDVVIFEVGLGGRFDSTNIIQPLASIITNIGLDHTNILGNTYEEIAFEKAGIIKENTSIFTAVKHPGAIKVIEEQADKKEAPLYRLNQEFSISAHKSLSNGEVFDVITQLQTIDQLEIRMIGQHQTENAALAVMAAQFLNQKGSFLITEQAIRTGLKRAYWPGRFEILSESPLVIIDGAHNEEGISALTHELSTRYQNRSIQIVFAALSDKKLDQMIAKLDQLASQIVFVSFDFPRAAKAEELLKISQSPNKLAVDDWGPFLIEEIQNIDNNSMLVITGSLYFISEVKPFLANYLKNKIISL